MTGLDRLVFIMPDFKIKLVTADDDTNLNNDNLNIIQQIGAKYYQDWLEKIISDA